MNKEILKKFSKLVLKIGVNLQRGQRLEIACPIEKSAVAHALSEQAYKMGAEYVRVRWEDEKMEKLFYLFAPDQVLTEVPKHLIDYRNELIQKNYCFVAISAENPSAFKDVPAIKSAMVLKARGKKLKKYSDALMSNQIRWCVVSVPTKEWAKHVFPKAKNSSVAQKLLATEIEKCMRLNYQNPVDEWNKHICLLNKRTQFLNEKNFEYIIFKNKLGTNLKVGLANSHVWLSALEKDKSGIDFVANMPTEEVFTAPHRLKVNGIVYSAIPLCYNGQIVDGFSLTFKNGKIVKCDAKVGLDVLENILKTDGGIRRLGEIALVGRNSPIAQSKILFYNTLFDENASCHLALGKAYPTTIKNGTSYNKTQLKALGANDSIDHIDFMIGTDDLTVYGVDKLNDRVEIFKDGDWVI